MLAALRARLRSAAFLFRKAIRTRPANPLTREHSNTLSLPRQKSFAEDASLGFHLFEARCGRMDTLEGGVRRKARPDDLALLAQTRSAVDGCHWLTLRSVIEETGDGR